jgi:pimeloyl-ACP methyl ester carboxylesterase
LPAYERGLAVTSVGAGPTLVLINGYAASRDDWDPSFLDALARDSTVLCPDNRGIGASPPVAAPLRIGTMADDILALLDAVGVGPVDVVGWSMGGFIAQVVAQRAPVRVRRLVLLATDPGGPRSVKATEEVWSRLIDHGGTPREQATRLLFLLFGADVARAVDAEFGELVAQARAALSHATLTAQEEAIDRWRAEPADARLASIRMPVLIAGGSDDVVIPIENSRRLHAALPGSELMIFDGVGHAFMAQEPGPLGARIGQFLGRQR